MFANIVFDKLPLQKTKHGKKNHKNFAKSKGFGEFF
jgi:hypothetical protein